MTTYMSSFIKIGLGQRVVTPCQRNISELISMQADAEYCFLHCPTAKLKQGSRALFRGEPRSQSPNLTSIPLDSFLFPRDGRFSEVSDHFHAEIFPPLQD